MELHSTWFRGRTWGSVMGVANMIVPNATVRTRAGSLQKCILNLGDVNHLVRGPIPKVCRTTSSLGGGKILAISKGRYKHRRGKKKTNGSCCRLFRIKIGFGSIEARHSFNIASQNPLHHNQTSCQAGNAYRR